MLVDHTTSHPLEKVPQTDHSMASSVCPRCAFQGPHPCGPGAGPHAARLVCGACERFLRWLPKRRGGQL